MGYPRVPTLMKSIKTFDPTRPIYPNPSTHLPPPWPSGPRCASRPHLVAFPPLSQAPPPSTLPLDLFPRKPQPAPHNPHRRAPPLSSRLPSQIPVWPCPATRQPSHNPPPPPRLSRQTCWLYVNICVIVKFENYLDIKLLLHSWI
jgi:hypothetical protein